MSVKKIEQWSEKSDLVHTSGLVMAKKKCEQNFLYMSKIFYVRLFVFFDLNFFSAERFDWAISLFQYL